MIAIEQRSGPALPVGSSAAPRTWTARHERLFGVLPLDETGVLVRGTR